MSTISPSAPPVLHVPLPTPDAAELFVWFTVGDDGPPSERELIDAGLAWIETHCDEPLRSRLAAAFGDSGLSAHVHPRSAVSGPNLEIAARYRPPGWDRISPTTTHAVHVHVASNDSVPPLAHWAAVGLARGIARRVNGIIMEPLAGRVESTDSIASRLPGDGRLHAVSTITVVSSVDENNDGWLTCTGLRNFGLPELEIVKAPPRLIPILGLLMNAVAQHVLDAMWRTAAGGADATVTLEVEPAISRRSFLEACGCDHGADVDDRFVRVRFELRRRLKGHPFLTLVAPRGFRGGNAQWLRSVARRIGGPGR